MAKDLSISALTQIKTRGYGDEMKNLILVTLMGITISQAQKSVFTDSRDGKKYKSVKIGNQVWMAENLNFETNSESWCRDNDPENCDQFGRLYSWSGALKLAENCNYNDCGDSIKIHHQGVCPDGWHIPSQSEWRTLDSAVGFKGAFPQYGEYYGRVGIALKTSHTWARGEGYVDENDPLYLMFKGNGKDSYGFSVIPSGVYYRNAFKLTTTAKFWTTTQGESGYASGAAISKGFGSSSKGTMEEMGQKEMGLAIRCIKN